MKTIFLILTFLTSIFVLEARPGPFFGDAKLRAAAPSWKDAKPDAAVILNVGDRVLLSSNVYPDPFDGQMIIQPDGTINPKFCKKPVKIAGMSEEQASIVVFDHVCSQGVYNAKSDARVSVVAAKRFKP